MLYVEFIYCKLSGISVIVLSSEFNKTSDIGVNAYMFDLIDIKDIDVGPGVDRNL